MTQSPRQIVGRAIASALKVWLRSQLDSVTDLQLKIQSGNRQLLSGNIPQVNLTAQEAIYQGIQLTQVSVVATNIRVNFKQILKGNPLQLLEPVPIDLAATLPAATIESSLLTPLLKTAVTDLLQTLFANQSPSSSETTIKVIEFGSIQLQHDALRLAVKLRSEQAEFQAGWLQMSLILSAPATLLLQNLIWETERPQAQQSLTNHEICLGSEVDLRHLCVTPEAITCQGKLKIQP